MVLSGNHITRDSHWGLLDEEYWMEANSEKGVVLESFWNATLSLSINWIMVSKIKFKIK